MKGGIFETLLREGGEFVVEVANKLNRKLLASGSCSGSLKRQIEGLERVNSSLESIVERDLTISNMKSEIKDWQIYKRGTSSRAKGKKSGW